MEKNTDGNLIECSMCHMRLSRAELSDHSLCHEIENGNDDFWEENVEEDEHKEQQSVFSKAYEYLFKQKEKISLKGIMSKADEITCYSNSLIESLQSGIQVAASHILINNNREEEDKEEENQEDEDLFNHLSNCFNKDKVIASLSSHKIDSKEKIPKGSQCVICLESFHIGEWSITLPCSHLFHKNCIQKWLNTSLKCPLCKSAMTDLI